MTRIILIGAGTGGRALVELLHKDPSIKVVGVADKNERAPGLVLARHLGLPVSTSYRRLLQPKLPTSSSMSRAIPMLPLTLINAKPLKPN
jgi:FlaA1/EpsC-like NDP-sugar epimerase